MRNQRGFDLDPSCVLWLPFYKYGAEQTKIWDQSGNGNHGTITGAVPATYPFVNELELMPNQVDRDFSAASAWANVDLNAYNEADDLTITANGVGQYCTCPVLSMPTTVGKRYRLKYSVANIVQSWTVKSFDGTQTLGTIATNITGGVIDFMASTTGGLRLVAVTNTSSGDFDNFSLKEITGYESIGWGFDGSDDNVAVANHSSLDIINTITILAWMRLDPISIDTSSTDVIMSRGVWNGDGYYIGVYGINLLAFNSCQLGAIETQPSTAVFTSNVWQMMGFTKSGVTGLWYHNGIDATGAHADLTNMLTSARILYIGRYENAGIEAKCNIGEVCIFNRTFSSAEIRNYYELTRSRYGV